MLLHTERPLCRVTLCAGCPYQCQSCTLSASLVRTCSKCNDGFTLSKVDNTCVRTYPAIYQTNASVKPQQSRSSLVRDESSSALVSDCTPLTVKGAAVAPVKSVLDLDIYFDADLIIRTLYMSNVQCSASRTWNSLPPEVTSSTANTVNI